MLFLKDRIVCKGFFVFLYKVIFRSNLPRMQLRHSQGIFAFSVISNEHSFGVAKRPCSTLFSDARQLPNRHEANPLLKGFVTKLVTKCYETYVLLDVLKTTKNALRSHHHLLKDER